MRDRRAPWRDEWELLCEGCGYSIEGLAPEGKCPECGRAIASSRPEARVGTAWQRRPGVGSWFATVWACLRHPRTVARTMRIEERRTRSFGRAGVMVAAGVLMVVPGLAITTQLLRGEAPVTLRELTWGWAESGFRWILFALAAPCSWGLLAVTFAVLTGVETWGIQFFGRLHRSRMTPTVARAITAHATSGWVATSVLVSAGWALGLLLFEITQHRNVGALRGAMMLAPIWLPVVWGFVGLLCFEMIVYAGVLTCRFANRERPTTNAEREPARNERDQAGVADQPGPVAGAPGSFPRSYPGSYPGS